MPEDMSLEVSRVDHRRREVLELHRGLVAIEEIHAACGVGRGQVPSGFPRPLPARPSLKPRPPGDPKPQPHNTPKFCRNSDLTPICSSWFSNRTPLFLHTNLGGGGGCSG